MEHAEQAKAHLERLEIRRTETLELMRDEERQKQMSKDALDTLIAEQVTGAIFDVVNAIVHTGLAIRDDVEKLTVATLKT